MPKHDRTLPYKCLLHMLSLSLAAAALCRPLQAQGKSSAHEVNSLEVSGAYTYMRSNAPSGECGCFASNGGAASMQYSPLQPLGFVADIAVVHASNLLGSSENQTLLTYTFGPRYHFVNHRLGRTQPFLEALFGGAHTSSNFTYADGANGFAAVAGGGVDIILSHHLSVRAAEVDYVYTSVRNGVNNQQDTLRISGGLTFRLR